MKKKRPRKWPGSDQVAAYAALCQHPEIREMGDIANRLLKAPGSEADLARYEELKGRPPYLELNLFTLRNLVVDWRREGSPSMLHMVEELEVEIAAGEQRIRDFPKEA